MGLFRVLREGKSKQDSLRLKLGTCTLSLPSQSIWSKQTIRPVIEKRKGTHVPQLNVTCNPPPHQSFHGRSPVPAGSVGVGGMKIGDIFAINLLHIFPGETNTGNLASKIYTRARPTEGHSRPPIVSCIHGPELTPTSQDLHLVSRTGTSILPTLQGNLRLG